MPDLSKQTTVLVLRTLYLAMDVKNTFLSTLLEGGSDYFSVKSGE